jgi:small conductance mechanosensitive channel
MVKQVIQFIIVVSYAPFRLLRDARQAFRRSFDFTLVCFTACILIIFPFSASAQMGLPSKAESPEKPPTREVPIETTSDTELQNRLSSVLSRIEEFEGIRAHVKDGVVTLTGEALSSKAKEEVEELVSRFEGVIYIQNEVEQETEVESRLAPAFQKINQYGSRFIKQLPVIGVAFIVVLLFWVLSHLLARWNWFYKRLGVNLLLRNLIRQFLRTVVLLMGILLALDILDVTALVGAFVGTAGVLGLAIGFAFRDIVENYLAGMLLSIRSPFAVEDLVLIGSDEGKVVRMTTRELILMTLDGNHVRIPNSTVFKSVIHNFTRNPRRRFRFSFGVGTEENLLRVQEIGCRALKAMDGVLNTPPPFMRVEELGNFSVTIQFFGWIDQRNADWFKVNSNAKRLVKRALDEGGIDMPNETFTLRLHQVGPERRKETTRAGTPEPPVEEEARDVDVSVDRQLEEQIKGDLAASDEENLLSDGAAKSS